MIQFLLQGLTCHFREEVSPRDAELTGWGHLFDIGIAVQRQVGCEPTFVMKKISRFLKTRDPFALRDGALT